MKITKYLATAVALLILSFVEAQDMTIVEASSDKWSVFNRQVSYKDGEIHLNAKENDGMLWLKNAEFQRGTIEFELKGKDTPGRSFIGFAFHGKDNETFDAIYFRPFNFKNPEKKSKSVQYVSMPNYGWAVLRRTFPGEYEGEMNPTPESVDDWFHVKIEIDQPKVTVYVNQSRKPTLEIDQISLSKERRLGFWVGNNSEGWFKNLKITKK